MQYQEVLPDRFCSRLATSPLSSFCLLQDQSIFEKRGADETLIQLVDLFGLILDDFLNFGKQFVD